MQGRGGEYNHAGPDFVIVVFIEIFYCHGNEHVSHCMGRDWAVLRFRGFSASAKRFVALVGGGQGSSRWRRACSGNCNKPYNGRKTMTKEEFCTEMQDVLQTDEELIPETVLGDLEEWDSLAMMATMAFFDKTFGIKMGLKDFRAMQTLGDLMAKAGV